jgi:hypothetical protein
LDTLAHAEAPTASSSQHDERQRSLSGDAAILQVVSKRTAQHRSSSAAAAYPSLLDAIAGGQFDDHLTALAEAIDARRHLVHTIRSVTALAALHVGDLVRINHAVRPQYLAGMGATIVEIDDHAVTLRLQRPVGRFASGVLRCPPLALDRLPLAAAVEAAIAPAQVSSSSEP